jgi:hypothetical protein
MIYQSTRSNPLINYVDTQDRDEYWRAHGDHAFVMSPVGNGLDCHRTWEALALGSIPIVKKSILTSKLYDDLPVVIVNDWSEITFENLTRWKQYVLNNVFNMNKLTSNHWSNLIKSHTKLSSYS